MNLFHRAALAALILLCSACTSSISTYAQRPISDDEAVVLVGVHSKIPFSEARYCGVVCSAWYPLGGRREIMAFPMPVGSTFQLNAIYTMDNRVAPLNGSPMKIESRGIYYYGTIISDSLKVGVRPDPVPLLLLAAKRKYGNRFDSLKTVNFTWPDPAEDSRLPLSYQDSPLVQGALRNYPGRKLLVTSIASPASPDVNCRGGESLSLPDFLPYEEYIRRALNHELQSAQLLAEGPGTMPLQGSMTTLTFSSTGEAGWTLGLQLQTPNGDQAKAQVTVPFKAEWSAAMACPAAEDAVPGAVQKLLEQLVLSPEFGAMLAPAPSP